MTKIWVLLCGITLSVQALCSVPERDPFVLPDVLDIPLIRHQGDCPKGWQLQGTVTGDEERALAFINNKLFEKGAKVDGFRLTRIEKDHVTLRRGTQVCVVKAKSE